MSEYYTNVEMRGNNILLRGIRDGVAFSDRVPFMPTLYLPSNKETEYQTLEGKYVEPIMPGSISDCREFINKYKNVQGFDLYGNTEYIYQFIAQHQLGEVDYDMSNIKIATFDIETTCENGFPDIETVDEQVIAITCSINGKTVVYGLGDFDVPEEHYCFDSEEELLLSFLDMWHKESPDIVTGWNVKFFDIPYLVNRLSRILPKSEVNKLSPWGVIKQRTVVKMNREHIVYELVGISTLDYYDLYRTFTYVNQESYRLDHIAHVELGERKLSYAEFDSISDFYKKDFQKFIEYNVKDVELIIKLEEKMKLLELAIALAYSAKVNFKDVFSQVRTWDAIIYHYLDEHKIVIPQKKHLDKGEQYAGAYVKDPIVGMHDWVVSFDLNSLYPHLIMQYNISPETKVDTGDDRFGMGVENLLKSSPEIYHKGCQEKLQHFKSMNYSVAANGTCYTKKHQGFLPALMEKMYEERSMYKKKMIECQKRQQAGESGLENQIAKFNNFQLVRKIQLNSAYGAIGNQYFRYFDVEMAEAITLSGQLSIRWIQRSLNKFLNKTIGTEEYDYVVASDTDSVYLRLGNLVDKVCANKTKSEVVGFLDKASEEVIAPFIEKEYTELATMMNAYSNKMVMGREVIADKGIWTAKKRYMLNVHDSEGVRYTEPKLKIMGIETTRSSTPQVVRGELKGMIDLIMNTDEDTVIERIDEFKNKFLTLQPEDISFPRGVSGLDKYKDSTHIYRKSTPIAVKGALIYNYHIEQKGLGKKYRLIYEGDKIKFVYLKKPNPMGGAMGNDQVISFPSSLPKEFDLQEFIDYETQFQKTFLDPLKTILDSIGWSHEKSTTLEEFFS